MKWIFVVFALLLAPLGARAAPVDSTARCCVSCTCGTIKTVTKKKTDTAKTATLRRGTNTRNRTKIAVVTDTVKKLAEKPLLKDSSDELNINALVDQIEQRQRARYDSLAMLVTESRRGSDTVFARIVEPEKIFCTLTPMCSFWKHAPFSCGTYERKRTLKVKEECTTERKRNAILNK